MSDIQRWRLNGGSIKDDGAGPYVRYADHVEALRLAQGQAYGDIAEVKAMAYEQGQRDALAKAEQAVVDSLDYDSDKRHIRRVFAAIKGEQSIHGHRTTCTVFSCPEGECDCRVKGESDAVS